MRRALVATTDGSERSFRVFPSAIRLARAARLEFCVLHIIDDTVERTAFPADARERVANRMKETQARIREELQRLQVEATVNIIVKPLRVGLSQAILDAAVALGAVVLAMDSRGQDFMRVAILGSIARRVLAESHIPVLMSSNALADNPRTGRYRVLACTDGSAKADAIGRSMTGMLLEADAEVAILHLQGEPAASASLAAGRAVDQLERWFPAGITARQVEDPGDDGDVAERVIALAAREDADVIALATHGFRLARRLGPGSVGMSVLGESPVPVLFGH